MAFNFTTGSEIGFRGTYVCGMRVNGEKCEANAVYHVFMEKRVKDDNTVGIVCMLTCDGCVSILDKEGYGTMHIIKSECDLQGAWWDDDGCYFPEQP